MLRKTLEGQAKADTVSTKTLLIRHVGVKRLGTVASRSLIGLEFRALGDRKDKV